MDLNYFEFRNLTSKAHPPRLAATEPSGPPSLSLRSLAASATTQTLDVTPLLLTALCRALRSSARRVTTRPVSKGLSQTTLGSLPPVTRLMRSVSPFSYLPSLSHPVFTAISLHFLHLLLAFLLLLWSF